MNIDNQSQELETHEDRPQTYYLWWLNEKTGKRHSAGVAFYSDQYAEFRLKLDFFPQNQFYLKTVGSHDSYVEYSAEIVIKKRGKFAGRRQVGTGIYSNDSGNEILIELGPFKNPLLLVLN